MRQGEFNRDQARLALEKILMEGVEFDAIFAGDDDSAAGIMLALRQAGWRVPEDVAVVGFDDSLFASSLVPPLTTVHTPTEQVGREAVRQLIHIIHGDSVEPRLVLSTELVIRQSCGCHD